MQLVQGPGPALRHRRYRLKDPCCWPASTNSTTASRCRSSRCFRASCCSRSRTAWRCARCCRRTSTAPSSTGPTSASPTTRPSCASAAQAAEPGGPGRLHLDGGRRRRRLRAARHRRREGAGGDGRDGRRRTARSEGRATEASVRGFWKAYRAHMELLRERCDTTCCQGQPHQRRLCALPWTATRSRPWPEFFTDACRYLITNDENDRRGYQAGIVVRRFARHAAKIASRRCARRTSTSGQRYRHSPPCPTLARRRRRHGQARHIVRGRPDHARRAYRSLRDRARTLDSPDTQADGSLRLAERIVVCDSSIVDTLLAIPSEPDEHSTSASRVRKVAFGCAPETTILDGRAGRQGTRCPIPAATASAAAAGGVICGESSR